jgi:hypothetical protein
LHRCRADARCVAQVLHRCRIDARCVAPVSHRCMLCCTLRCPDARCVPPMHAASHRCCADARCVAPMLRRCMLFCTLRRSDARCVAPVSHRCTLRCPGARCVAPMLRRCTLPRRRLERRYARQALRTCRHVSGRGHNQQDAPSSSMLCADTHAPTRIGWLTLTR